MYNYLLQIDLITGRNEVVAKVIFLHLSVILLTEGGGGVCQGEPPLAGRTPPQTRETPPRTRETPLDKADPPDQADPPPGPGRPPSPWTRQAPPAPREADSSIRSTSGRYASYWNAFLFPLLLFVVLIYLTETNVPNIPVEYIY